MRRSASSGPCTSGASGRVAGVLAALLAAVAVAGCLAAPGGPARTAVPPVQPVRSGVIAATRAEVERALRAAGFGLADASRPYRPPESTRMTGAARGVYRIVLRNPDAGHLLIYEFPDARAAYDAAKELAAYLGSGPGRIQFASDTQHVVRVVGSTVVVFSWSPSATGDPRVRDAAAAIETIGQSVPVQR